MKPLIVLLSLMTTAFAVAAPIAKPQFGFPG